MLKPVGLSSSERGTDAEAALGGSPNTFWHTQYYYSSPHFGNLKPGTGLLLDMGQQVRLSQLQVEFGTTCCAHIEIGVGNSPVASSPSSFTVVAQSTTAQGNTNFPVTSTASGRYVLLWITRPATADQPARQL